MDIKNLNRIFLPFFKTIELKLGVNIDNKQTKSNTTRNKGNGAGGNNTNYYGKKFEQKTNNEKRLLDYGFSKKDNYYLSKTFEDKSIVFVSQNGLKKYMKNNYKVELFRNPDEAYIIEYNNGKKVLKILEKKEQHMHGSVETKLSGNPDIFRKIPASFNQIDSGSLVIISKSPSLSKSAHNPPLPLIVSGKAAAVTSIKPLPC